MTLWANNQLWLTIQQTLSENCIANSDISGSRTRHDYYSEMAGCPSFAKVMSLSRLILRTATLSRGAWSSRLLPARPLRAPYSAAAGLSRDTIQTRILDVVKTFEKVDEAKVVSLFKPHIYF